MQEEKENVANKARNAVKMLRFIINYCLEFKSRIIKLIVAKKIDETEKFKGEIHTSYEALSFH